ncbi:hypothetical protein ACH5RR_002549 [Cinchona calisaya]|uniref:NDH-dependent cyclic electron flow 5 n=1 Tax=Cinchona calisaya TaxID=153742 RepID=A0ABD3ASD9_9GENT
MTGIFQLEGIMTSTTTNFIPLSTITKPVLLPSKITTHHLIKSPSASTVFNISSSKKREPRLPSVARVSCPPLDAGCLENEYGGHGVSFSGIGEESCVVKMAMENGSVAKLMLPTGLITSYKPLMWHGGTMELLHTSVSEGEDGEALIHGGVSLDLRCDLNGNLWTPKSWDLRGVNGSPQEFIQVELISQSVDRNVEVKHIITLKEDVLSSEIVVCNSTDSSLHFTGAFISHLTVSTPEATYAMGLQGSDFYCRPPVLTDFSLIHPSFGKTSSRKAGGLMAFMEQFSLWGGRHHKDDEPSDQMTEETAEVLVGEEDDDYKNLAEEISRIYTSAPRDFTVLDRGRRNSVLIGRNGFKELYMFSPGSSHEWYGKYSYICVGQAALLQPVTLGSQSEWRGKQRLCNPNL